ncbi:hypothetical protein [Paenibacillus agaridevorans]|uniref:hypothetical protein n=1 Tax=Paenibacillus agaridevorans TaxID=171404 RepID=UPI001BE41930|nr:hypothetical protein [Paenibacillus agaridevorans]
MKKKAIITLLIILVLLSTIYFLLCLKEKKNVENTLNGFYKDFINKEYANLYKYFDIKFRTDLNLNEKHGYIVQPLIDDRHWYGDIKGIQYKPILWLGKNKRYVFVEVEYGYESAMTETDKIRLEKLNNEWVITKYNSGSPVNLP